MGDSTTSFAEVLRSSRPRTSIGASIGASRLPSATVRPVFREESTVYTAEPSVQRTLQSAQMQQKGCSATKIALQVMIGIAILAIIVIAIWIGVEFSNGNVCVEPPQTVVYTNNPDGSWTSVTTFAKDKSTQLICRGRGQTVENCSRVPRSDSLATPLIPMTLGTDPQTTTAQVVVTQPAVGNGPATPVPPADKMTTVVVGGVTAPAVPVTAVVVTKTEEQAVSEVITSPAAAPSIQAAPIPNGSTMTTMPTAVAVTATTVAVEAPVPSVADVAVNADVTVTAPPPRPQLPVRTCQLDPKNVEQKILDYVDQEYDAIQPTCVPEGVVSRVLNDAEEDGLFDDEPLCDQDFEIPTVSKILGQYNGGCAGGACPTGKTRISGLENWDAVPCDDNLTMGLTNATLRSRNDVLPVGAENWVDQDSDLTKSNQLKLQQLGGFLPFDLPRRADIEPLDNLPFSYNPHLGTPGEGAQDLFLQDPEQESYSKQLELGTFRRAIQYGTKDASRVSSSSNPYAKYRQECVL